MSTIKSIRVDDRLIGLSDSLIDFVNNGWIKNNVSFTSLINEGLIDVLWKKIWGYLPYCETSHPKKFPIIDKNGNVCLVEPTSEQRSKIWNLAFEIKKLQLENTGYYLETGAIVTDEDVNEALIHEWELACDQNGEEYDEDEVIRLCEIAEERKKHIND